MDPAHLARMHVPPDPHLQQLFESLLRTCSPQDLHLRIPAECMGLPTHLLTPTKALPALSRQHARRTLLTHMPCTRKPSHTTHPHPPQTTHSNHTTSSPLTSSRHPEGNTLAPPPSKLPLPVVIINCLKFNQC